MKQAAVGTVSVRCILSIVLKCLLVAAGPERVAVGGAGAAARQRAARAAGARAAGVRLHRRV